MTEAIMNDADQETGMMEKRIYDLKNLIGLGISLSSNLDFESLVESILYSIIGQMFVEKVVLLLQVDIDVANYYIHLSKGFDTPFDRRRVVLMAGSPLVSYLEQNPVPHDFREFEEIGDLAPALETIRMFDPRLVVPMKSKDTLNGIIIMGGKLTGEEFTAIEKEFMYDLSRFAAIAVENSRLYLMATLDRMTRLYIHHYFQERLDEEMRRSRRNGTPLSLIISDIDHFKNFNDTYGHQQGDSVLKESAGIFRKNLRSVDFPARYGGEEFAIILPETDLSSALIIAERLRKKIESHPYAGQEEPLHVTMSLGVAQFDTLRDQGKKDFIKRADAALYRAKDAGRNRVVADTNE